MTVQQEPQRNLRLESQVDLILEALQDAECHPQNWRESRLDYIARRQHCLVRDEDAGRVADFLGGEVLAREGNIRGLSVVRYPVDRWATVEEACSAADRQFGRGVVTPDHVLYLVPAGSTCPATEPEPVHSPGRPYPEPARDQGEGSGVLVSILDSGLFDGAETGYDWMGGVRGEAEDTYTSGPNPTIRPYAGHGAFSAGVVRTLAPGADVEVFHTFTPVAAGAIYESELASDLLAALGRGPDIISLAFGTYTREDIPLLGIDVLEPLLGCRSDVVLIAAAGNDSTRQKFWPAAFPWVTSVGALDRNWTHRAWFSNYGPWVCLYAPGEDLVNAYPKGEFVCREPPNAGQQRHFEGLARWSGTSFSTPMVAGMVAARMSATGESARDAVAAIRAQAVQQAIPGVGPVLVP